MMEPLPALRMAGMATFVPRKTPLALMSMTRSQSSSSVSSTRVRPLMPALFTRTSSLPYSATVAATTRSQLPSSVTSRSRKVQRPPDSLMRDWVWKSFIPEDIADHNGRSFRSQQFSGGGPNSRGSRR